MKKVFTVMLLGVLLLNVTGCEKECFDCGEEENRKIHDSKKESFYWGTTLEDGQHIRFALEVPYLKSDKYDLMDAFLHEELSVKEFLNTIEYMGAFNETDAKLYQYNPEKKDYGDTGFYVLSCNREENKDVFIARNKKTLEGKCEFKVNDLNGVSMRIKYGTLTKKGATVVITDTSSRLNVYGEGYHLEKYEDGIWTQLPPLHDLTFTYQGYYVGKDHTLEFDVDWEYHYGELSSGRYRIVKSTSEAGEGTNHYLTAEFVIE